MKFMKQPLRLLTAFLALAAGSLTAQNKDVSDIYLLKFSDIIARNGGETAAKSSNYISQKALAYAWAQSQYPEKAYDAYYELMNQYPDQVDAWDRLSFALAARKMELYGISDSLILDLKDSAYASENIFSSLNAEFYNANKDLRSDYWSAMDFTPFYVVKPFISNTEMGEYGLVMNPRTGSAYYSTHKDVELRKATSGWFDEPYYTLYQAKYMDSFLAMGSEISHTVRNAHHAANFLDTQTGFLYITRNARKPNANKERVLQIYRIKQDPVTKAWEEQAFPLNNVNYNISSLVFSPDGASVYFASDMPGGFGKSDIYRADVLVNDDQTLKIGDPVNLGPKINTMLRENFPTFDAQGNMHFASDGHLGFGGLDIFSIDAESGAPVNLGKPVNSNMDDFAPVLVDHWGVISSNRMSQGYNDNLYFFRWSDPVVEVEELPIVAGDIVVKIIDAETGDPVKDAALALDNLADEAAPLQGISDSTGTFVFSGATAPGVPAQLRLTAHPCGYMYALSDSVAVNGDGATMMILVNKFRIGDDLGELFEVKPIYYELNKFELTESSKAELDRVAAVLIDNPGLSIELGSHTDSRGSAAYNQNLSENRAKSSYNYLLGRGVTKERMTYVGYGESRLINRCADGVTCSDDEHAANRRTEYLINGIIPCDLLPKATKASLDGPELPVAAAPAPEPVKPELPLDEQNKIALQENQGPIVCGDADGDNIPDYLDTDSDNDGLPDAAEGRADSDGDGFPNFLDKDSDNDGIADAVEKMVDSDKDGKPNCMDTDSDGDGIEDKLEGLTDSDSDGKPNYLDTDSDGDDISDKIEGSQDRDGDGIPNFLDLDSDGDGISDKVEGTKDSDKDGKPNYLDKDSDNDTMGDDMEAGNDPLNPRDTDLDGTPDYLDMDSDEDGIPDKVEAPQCLPGKVQEEAPTTPDVVEPATMVEPTPEATLSGNIQDAISGDGETEKKVEPAPQEPAAFVRPRYMPTTSASGTVPSSPTTSSAPATRVPATPSTPATSNAPAKSSVPATSSASAATPSVAAPVTSSPAGPLEYRVQFIVSKTQLSQSELAAKGVPNAFEYIENGFYKYTTGESFSTMEQARAQQGVLKAAGFTDAFVVKFSNGQRVR